MMDSILQDPTSRYLVASFSAHQMESLPLKRRLFEQLVTIVPGAIQARFGVISPRILRPPAPCRRPRR